ncbi:MAG: GNAT family N-acetyltransferase [Cyanobacteria bacterium P01_G01_bin.67]
MIQIDYIETLRLIGERVKESHLPLWKIMGSDPQVMATMGGIWTQKKTLQKMQSNFQHWSQYGHGQWTFFDKATKKFVGRGGIRKVIVNEKLEVELGYALMPEYWGHGLAVEIGKKALSIAFDQFQYLSVVCFTLTNNKQSQRVMEKIGFCFESNIVRANQPHVLYRYLKSNYSYS